MLSPRPRCRALPAAAAYVASLSVQVCSAFSLGAPLGPCGWKNPFGGTESAPCDNATESPICQVVHTLDAGLDFVEDTREGVDFALEKLGPLVFGAGAGDLIAEKVEMVTFGFEITTWMTKMAVTKVMGPDMCEDDGSTDEARLLQESWDLITGIFPTASGGTFFTSTLPTHTHSTNQAGENRTDGNEECAAYPGAARFCSSLGHSHLVTAHFHDPNFASLRDRDAELAWAKIQQSDTIKKMAERSQVCRFSLMDALCLDALPMCNTADLTACTLSCRNVLICFDEFVMGTSGAGTEEIENKFSGYVARCHEMCENSAGLDEMLNVSSLLMAFEEPGSFDAADVARDSHVTVAIANVGIAVALSMAALFFGRCRFRRAPSTREMDGSLDDGRAPLGLHDSDGEACAATPALSGCPV